jgi:osmotically inducible lipoprotein OsmB
VRERIEERQGYNENIHIAIAAATALIGLTASARAEERKDNNSTLTGAAIGAGTGAVIAGPPGTVVDGVVGAVIGGPKIVYCQGHRSYTDEKQRHYYWDNHRRHYYVIVD